MKQNLIALAVNISRAYEISRCGGHSMSIMYDVDSSENLLTIKSNALLLGRFYDVRVNNVCDIMVEIGVISPEDILTSYTRAGDFETLEDVEKRVERVRKTRIKPSLDIAGMTGGANLLKTAIIRCNLSVCQVNSVLSVSCTIAKMSASKTVLIEHLAEAIQYQSVKIPVRSPLDIAVAP